MSGWAPYTIVRLVFFLVAGILSYIHLPGLFSESLYLALAGVCLVLYLFVWAWRRYKSPPSHVLRRPKYLPEGLLVFTITFLFGTLHTHYANDAARKNHILYHPSVLYYKAVVASEVQAQQAYLRTELIVHAVRDSAGWKPAQGKVLASFEKNEGKPAFQHGDVLLIKGSPAVLKPPTNPGEFDYRQLMSYRQVYFQHYIRHTAYQVLPEQSQSPLRDWSLYARQQGRQVLESTLGNAQEYAIAAALVLGIKEGLDVELRNAYAAAGAMHVLAVSGLHVGIIFWILGFSLKPLKKYKWGKWIFLCIVLLVLWSYAFITGLSASVLRAVIMFSIVSVAQAFQRQSNIYNTLAMAAFVMLCWNPYLIMSVGFQLSFAAVIGIVYLYPRLNRWFAFRNKVATYFWQITCVSVAAQLATFPLGIYYFHQFPLYFWLANLVVIPVALAILVGGLILIGISLAGIASEWISWPLSKLVEGLNWVVKSVEGLPNATIDGLMLSTPQTIAIYALIAAMLFFFDQKTYAALKVALVMLTFIVCSLGVRYWQQSRQQQLVIYNIRNHSAIALHEGKNLALLADSSLLAQPARIRFFLQQDWWQRGVEQVLRSNLQHPELPLAIQRYEHMGVAVWNGRTIVWLDSPSTQLPGATLVEADILIVQKNAIRSLADLERSRIRFKMLVLDSSNKPYLAKALQAQALEQGLTVHNVATEGAFILPI